MGSVFGSILNRMNNNHQQQQPDEENEGLSQTITEKTGRDDQQGATGATGAIGAAGVTGASSSARCLICLSALAAVFKLRELLTKEGLVNCPPSCPPNVWRDRNWFLICLNCFADFLKDKAPIEGGAQDDDFHWDDLDFNLLDGPLSSMEEDVFWGDFREQRITEYLEELGQLIIEELEPYNFENSRVFQDEFWNNADFWTEIQEQWTCEMEVEFEILHDFQNSS